MPLILGTNSIKDTGFNVANSLRFNDDDTPRLTRTPSSSGNRRTFTISIWIKLGAISTSTRNIFSAASDGSNYALLRMENHRIEYLLASGSVFGYLSTNRLFRDPSAWYHVVVAIDTTNGTAGNRMRLYINGVEETDFNVDTNPSQNADTLMNHTNEHNVGMFLSSSSSAAFDGYVAELVVIDGQQLSPTSFGEFDSDTNIWKPIDVSDLTFGTNGIHLDFEDSSTLGNDVSGNNNDFSSHNLTATDQTTDTCTNNFSTLNPIYPNTGINAFTEGNTVVEFTGGGNGSSLSTFGLQAGRWYAECKIITTGNGVAVGIFGTSVNLNNWVDIGDGIVYVNGGQKNLNGTEISGQGASFTDNDIIGVALDITNGDVEFFKNGSSQFTENLSNITTGGNSDSVYFFGFSDGSGATSGKGAYNFGNPSFSISSGNSDAEGFGNFEHSVPSGFFALCSKNLAEYG